MDLFTKTEEIKKLGITNFKISITQKYKILHNRDTVTGRLTSNREYGT